MQKVSGCVAPEDWIGHAFSIGDIPAGLRTPSSAFEERPEARLEMSLQADTAEAATKLLQGLASSFEFNIYWIYMEKGSDRQRTDFIAAAPGGSWWTLRTERELEVALRRVPSGSTSGASAMNLTGRSTDTRVDAGSPIYRFAPGGVGLVDEVADDNKWSEETTRCLRDLNMVLMSYGEAARSLKLPGIGEMYSELQKLISDIIIGGPKVLAARSEKAGVDASTVYRALK